MNEMINPNKKKTKNIPKVKELKSFDEEYLDMFTMKPKPIHKDYLHHLACELIECAKNKEIFSVNSYCVRKGIRMVELTRFAKRYEFLQEAIEFTRMICGITREEGALKNELNAAWVSKTQPLYDPAFKELEEWRAQLRQQNDPEKTKIEVIIPPIGKLEE